jgi:spermidine/putrescine-binding protein
MRKSAQMRLAGLAVSAVMLAVACTAQPGASSPAATSAAPTTGASASASAAASGTVHVSIVNKDMTPDDVKAAIQAEGSLVVANWTYTANDELVKQFKAYVKSTYGVDVNFTYEGSQSPSVYLTKLYAAQKGGNPSPYDVMAIEENYWAEAVANGAVENYLPSGLIPNQSLVLDMFQHVPTSIAFQSTAFPGVVYEKSKVQLTKLMDLAKPELRKKVTLPLPGDITAGGFFLGLATELGKDYKDAAQMKEVVDWAVTNIGPNVVKYTTDSAEMQRLLRSGAVNAVSFWNSLARLEYFSGKNPDATLLLPAAIFPANGYLWIPKGAAHPVLAQIFINWRLSPEVQFPNKWPIDHGPWSELSEGFLGPSYVTQVPDWFAADYFKYFPNLDQIQTQFKQVDWDAYNKSQKEWQDYYAQKIGQ